MAGPLAGQVVLALEQAVAAPLATRLLADAGARVIKIERVGDGDFARNYDDARGPGLSSWFLWLNRGKESVELDLKSLQGREVIAALFDRVDIVVQNLLPGALDRLGCSLTDLRTRRPEVITCSITGYGPDGPYRDRKAYDLLIQAEMGLVSLTGTPEAPAKVGISIADIAGGMYAYSNTLLALLQRHSTGQGAHIDVSLFDALTEWMGHQITYTHTLGRQPRRAGARHATIAPYGPFPCADGTEVLIAVQNTREWTQLCQVLGRPDLSDDPRFATNEQRVAAGAELDDELSAATRQLTSDEFIARLDAVPLAWGRLNDVHALLAHPQLEARQRWVEVDSPGGPFSALRPPVDISGIDIDMRPPPALGEHTREVLAWLGLTDTNDKHP